MRYPKEALERGYRSAAALPLVVEGTAIGALVLYSAEAGFFDDEETKLLVELAGDISFAINHIDKAEKLELPCLLRPAHWLANRSCSTSAPSNSWQPRRQRAQDRARYPRCRRFKTINDSLGRQEGDALLKQIAERMSQNDDGSSRIARISADHFAVVGRGAQSEDEVARRVERRMQRVFGPPFRIGTLSYRINAKAGIALFPNDGSDPDTLFRNAESALRGRNRRANAIVSIPRR